MYRRFIKDFVKRARLLNSLLINFSESDWEKTYEEQLGALPDFKNELVQPMGLELTKRSSCF